MCSISFDGDRICVLDVKVLRRARYVLWCNRLKQTRDWVGIGTYDKMGNKTPFVLIDMDDARSVPILF